MPTNAPRTAYTGVINDGKFGIGLAEESKPGYWPKPDFGTFPTFSAAMDRAQELNRAKGLTDDESFQIVASSMFSTKRRKQ